MDCGRTQKRAEQKSATRISRIGVSAILLLTIALGPFLATAPRVTAQNGDEIFNSIGMKFVLIPRGSFQMGSPADDEHRYDDEPIHRVQLTKSFHMGAFEVTQKQFERVMGINPSYFTAEVLGKIRSKPKSVEVHPVESVTWKQADEFCRKLSDRADEKDQRYTYRLPTEAEWEFACRAGTTSALFFGDDISAAEANFNGVAPLNNGRAGAFLRSPWTIGGYRGNVFGLFDMHGNVAEWCADWYDADYYTSSPKADPTGPAEGTEKVVRGGGWPHTARACRSASRHKLPPDFASYSVGFRVVLEIGE